MSFVAFCKIEKLAMELVQFRDSGNGKNGDGTISSRELRAIMKKIGDDSMDEAEIYKVIEDAKKDDGSIDFEEFYGDQRGLYFKNAREKLFVALLVEANETTIYYVTFPFDSFSNESWNGATHLSLRCNEESPMG